MMGKKKIWQWGRWISDGPVFAEGGQGRLYIVRDGNGEHYGKFVLKELKNPHRVGRFQTELDAISKLLRHPNIIELVDYGIYRDPTKPCYVMPFADGTLVTFVQQNKFEFKRIFEIFERICCGVAHLHSSGIIHRDIKPENILMFGDNPRVSDFGLALIADIPRETQTGEAVGPRFYMAPELEDGRCLDVGTEADVYSLGKLLYFMLSGGKIFAREKYRQRDFALDRQLSDDRLQIFNVVFGRSVTSDRHQREATASHFFSLFMSAREKFAGHPRTRLIERFGGLEAAVASGDYSGLDALQWSELFDYVTERQRLVVPENFWVAAAEAVEKDSSQALASCIRSREDQLSEDVIEKTAARIVGLPELSIWLTLGGRDNLLSWIMRQALRSSDVTTCVSVARHRLSELRSDPLVIALIAPKFSLLPDDAQQNFLIAATKIEYSGKEDLLLSLLITDGLSDLALETVIAGLCLCGTQRALEHVHNVAETTIGSPRMESVLRGIALGSLGSTHEARDSLRRFDWSSGVIPIILNSMSMPSKDSEPDD